MHATLLCLSRGKRVYSTTVAPLLSRSVARGRGHKVKEAIVYTIVLGKQGKRVYTIGPERRVYTIEASDPEKREKRRVSTVVVYTFFREEKGTQTQTFESGYFLVGWGSST